MNTFFTSDNHFFHKNIKKFCPTTRHGADVAEMNSLMVQAWNSRVTYEDTIYSLGDFSFGTEEQTIGILQRLNGHKHLIYGNHDKVIRNSTRIQGMFETINDYKKLTIDGTKIILFHYPMREWESMHHGAYHLYGHVHGGLEEGANNGSKPWGRSMDVGIDARHDQCDMMPWSFQEIKRILEKREILAHHHKKVE